MLNSLIPNASLFEQGKAGGGEAGGDFKGNIVSVVNAEILPNRFGNNESSIQDRLNRMYSLGIVFYELFSGGEMPLEIKEQSNTKNNPPGESGGIEFNAIDPLMNGQFFDLAGELNILDDFDGGDLFEDLDNNPDNIEEQMPNKKKGPQKGTMTMWQVSVDPLKLKGLPMSLCNLIENMIDAINGDLSGEEAYHSMSDVRSDLQLMLDKPNRFLHDMDLDKLAVTGLQVNEVVLKRDAELSALKDSHRRSVSGKNEVGIVVGQSGVGKSVLAQQLGSFVTATGGLFLSGKFDQLQQAKPFSALASAFNEYCHEMSKKGRSTHMQKVASELRTALGKDAHHLVRVIPKLSIILGSKSSQQDEGQDCVNAQDRLHYLLSRFVDIISLFSGAPITLFLDDVQWADPASIGVIHKLLLMGGSFDAEKQIFFLLSSREEGLLEGHPFGEMVSGIENFDVRVTTVELACMDKDMTNRMVSELLCLSPRLTRTLSEIVHHKTKGNLLFFTQLLISLYKDGLVRLSLSRRRWEWDEDLIASGKLPDDVAEFMALTIGRLPKDVQTSLCTLSCFGAYLDVSVIQALETQFGKPLFEPLDSAVAEGILDKINSVYRFGHDRLQEAAYNMILPEDRCLFHFKYGIALASLSLDIQDDSMLFVAAGQINRGGPTAVESKEHAGLMANFNLKAGKKALEMSDFSSAYSYFDHGISFLRKRHWVEHYDLSLSLFEAASKCAVVLGDGVSLKILSEQVLTFAKSFEDTLNSLYYVITALASASKLSESVDKCLLVLTQLGEELPEYSESSTKLQIQQTHDLLQSFTDRELIEYKMMDDSSKVMAMKFFARLALSVQMLKPDMHPSVTLKMVQLSIAHGLSPFTPIGLTHFGQLLARIGKIEEGCRYVKIAKELQERIGSKEVLGEVIATGTQVLCFIDPMQTTIELHTQGHATAMAAGDTHGALLNSCIYVGSFFWSGAKLAVCKKEYARSRKLMEEANHLTWLAHISQMEKNVLLLTDTQYNQETQDMQDGNPHVSWTYFFQKMYISFIFRHYEQMKSYAEKFFQIHMHTWALLYIHTNHSFYGGIVSYLVYRQTNDTIWLSRGDKAKLAMSKWTESSKHNFQHKAYLLEAEAAFCNDDAESAKSYYDMAIAAARQHRFINDEALACELAGYFYFSSERKDTALQFFMKAHAKYHEWGAVAKSNALFEFVQKAQWPVPGPLAREISDSSSDDGLVGSNRRKRGSDRSE